MPISQETEITDPDEQIHRNTPSIFFKKGLLTDGFYVPSKRDEGQRSVQQGSKADPPEAYARYTAPRLVGGEVKQYESLAIFTVSLAECAEESIKVYDDPITEEPPDDSHALMDMRHLSRREREIASKALVLKANNRRATYMPPTQGDATPPSAES